MTDEAFEKQRNALLIAGDWTALADLLDEFAKDSTGDKKRDALEELGSIYLQHLEDPMKAFAAWERMFRSGGNPEMIASYCGQILEQFPEFEPALSRLDPVLRLIGTAEAYKTLAGHYLDVSDACDDSALFLAYREKAAELFNDRLGEPSGAFMVMSSAVNSDTLNETLWVDLEDLARRSESEVELVQQVFPILQARDDSAELCVLCKRVGFFAMEFEANEVAIALFRRAATIRTDSQIREALNLLYQRKGEWDGVLEELEQQMDRAVDRVHQRELFERYIQTLERAAVETPPPRNAKWLATLGHVAADHQQNRPAAIGFWERALESDPTWMPAIDPLIDEYVGESDFDRALPLLETIANAAASDPRRFEPQRLKARLIQLCAAYESKGKLERSVDAIRRAYEIDPDDPQAMLRYGVMLSATDDYETAERVLRRLIVDFPTTLPPKDVAVALRIGAKAALESGHIVDARNWIVRSLELAPRSLEGLRILNIVGIETNNSEFRLQALESLASDSPDHAEQFKSRTDLGDQWVKVGRPDRATLAYESALSIEPNSILVLRKLLKLFQEAKRWGAAVAVLDRISNNELDSNKRATMAYTMAILTRDELRDQIRAVEYFDRALDEDPSMLKAFEAVDRILTDARAWSELERAYRRMLTRLEQGDPDVLFLLWKNLGEVYRTRMRRAEEAISCYETALSIRGEDESLRLILAELYQTSGLGGDSAVEQLNVVLKNDVRKFETLEALFSAHLKSQKFDAAFNVSAVLHAFDAGNFETTNFHTQYLGRNLKLAKAQFYPELLDCVYHHDLDRWVSAILSIVTYAVRGVHGRSKKEWGVTSSHRANSAKPASRFENMFWYFSRLVGPAGLELYIRHDHSLGHRNMQTDPPAILVGVDLLEPSDDRRFAFEFSKMLSGLRPELYLGCGVYTVENLNLFYRSAIDFIQGRKSGFGKEGNVIIKQIKGLPNALKMQLATFVQNVDVNTMPDLQQWLTAVDHTTSRFGLIISGDLQTSFRFMREQANPPTFATLNERLDELARFCLSDEHVRVRKELGLGL